MAPDFSFDSLLSNIIDSEKYFLELGERAGWPGGSMERLGLQHAIFHWRTTDFPQRRLDYLDGVW